MLRKMIFSPFDRWFSDNYGSRRGYLNTIWHRLCYLLGRYRNYREIDWNKVERLVFVCRGNICRSAYAEGLVKSLGVESVSCGLDTRIGRPANEYTIRAAKLKGIDLKVHTTTPIQELNLKKNDLFVAMEPWQAEKLKGLHGKEYNCTLLGLWGRPVNPYIADPYGTSDNYFNTCFNYIDISVHELLKIIRGSNFEV